MIRRYSEQEVDAHVEAEQHRRLDARRNDPRWRLVEDEFTPLLGGGVWVQVQEGEDGNED